MMFSFCGSYFADPGPILQTPQNSGLDLLPEDPSTLLGSDVGVDDGSDAELRFQHYKVIVFHNDSI